MCPTQGDRFLSFFPIDLEVSARTNFRNNTFVADSAHFGDSIAGAWGILIRGVLHPPLSSIASQPLRILFGEYGRWNYTPVADPPSANHPIVKTAGAGVILKVPPNVQMYHIQSSVASHPLVRANGSRGIGVKSMSTVRFLYFVFSEDYIIGRPSVVEEPGHGIFLCARCSSGFPHKPRAEMFDF